MELRSQYTKPTDSEQTRNYYLQNGPLTQPFLTAKEKAATNTFNEFWNNVPEK